MDFAEALAALKSGRTVQREGWNGKGLFLFLVPGSRFAVAEGRPMAKHYAVGREIDYHAHIDMQTAQGYVAVWCPSQVDILAEDWRAFENEY